MIQWCCAMKSEGRSVQALGESVVLRNETLGRSA
jgi:hypothetical protein